MIDPLSEFSDDEKTRATDHVHHRTKNGIKQYADAEGVPAHLVCRWVVAWYREGGLLRRLTEKFGRAVPEVEDALANLDPDSDSDLNLREKWTAAICRRLEDQFTQAELDETIGAVAGDSPPTLREYRERGLDRLGHVPHRNAPDLFVPTDHQYAVDPDAPAIDRLVYDDLTDEERVRGLPVELARRAVEQSTGKQALEVETVREGVFDGTPGARKVRELMDRAADDTPGFGTDVKLGTTRIYCDLDAVDPDLLADAGLTTDMDPSVSDEEDDDPVDVDEKMDALTDEATYVRTDGGDR